MSNDTLYETTHWKKIVTLKRIFENKKWNIISIELPNEGIG